MEQRLLRSAGKLWHDLDGVDAAERKHMLSELVGIIYILRYNSYTGHAYTTKERSPENADGQRHGHRHIHTAMVRPREEHVCGESIAHLDD